MRGSLARKLRKYSKRNWIEYIQEVEKWPFTARWRLAWYIVFHKSKRGKKQ